MRRIWRFFYDLYYLQGELRLALARFHRLRELRHRDREDAKLMKQTHQKVGRYG